MPFIQNIMAFLSTLIFVLVTLLNLTDGCIDTNFSPTHSKWAIGYNGTMYSAGFDGPQLDVRWDFSFDNAVVNDYAQYTWCGVEVGCDPPRYDIKYFSSPLIFSTLYTSDADYTETTFGSMVPLNDTFNNTKLTLSIDGKTPCVTNILVSECSQTLESGVEILYNDKAIYETNGYFNCPNNGLLFSEEGIGKSNNKTECLKNAKWDGEEGLQCWKAPLVTLYVSKQTTEKVQVTENTNVQLNCSYSQTIPKSTVNRYFLDDAFLDESSANDVLSFHVKREYHMKTVSCQAITPFTEIYKESGRSQTINLDVLYGPTDVNLTIWPKLTIDSVIFVNKSSEMNLTCETSSNPTAICLWNLPPKTLILKNQTCSILVKIVESGEVFCTASNSQNSALSQQESIIVVKERVASISAEIDGTEILEGSSVTLNCSVPYQNELQTKFSWSVPNANRNLDLTLSLLSISNLSKEDFGNYICTCIDVFGGSATSYFLNVRYQPYGTSISADTSNTIVMTDSGLLLNSTQTVTLHCASDSNPEANCSFDAPFTKWSESCSINRDFTTSGSVSCSTNNGIGNTGKSQTLSVVVVEQRTSDVILGSPDEGSVQSGYDVTLNCSVAYQDDLNTIFEWTIPSDRTIDVTDSILTLNNLTRFDRGNYICQTRDAFSTSTISLFLDVLYGASKDPGSKTTCTWSEVANNSCFLNFHSNPPTKDYTLTHEDTGEDATCQNCHFETIGSENVTQRFIFALSQTSNEAASFNLRILSSGFPDLVVTFVISDAVPIDYGDDQTVVIIASVIGGIVFIAILLAALAFIRRKGFFDKNGKQLSVTTSNKIQHVDDGGYEQFQQPAKNLNIDQGAVQTSDHYMNVAFRQTDGHEYDTDIPSANGTYEVPLKEEHKYAEIRNRKGSYETTILP